MSDFEGRPGMTEGHRDPWSGPWTTNTVEAVPDPSSLVGVLLARTEQLESCRAWTVALEQRIEEIKALCRTRDGIGSGYLTPSYRFVQQIIELCDSELVADA